MIKVWLLVVNILTPTQDISTFVFTPSDGYANNKTACETYAAYKREVDGKSLQTGYVFYTICQEVSIPKK